MTTLIQAILQGSWLVFFVLNAALYVLLTIHARTHPARWHMRFMGGSFLLLEALDFYSIVRANGDVLEWDNVLRLAACATATFALLTLMIKSVGTEEYSTMRGETHE